MQETDVKEPGMRSGVWYCYVDTNAFLHYRSFAEIDWCEELEVDDVVLVVCPAVVRELDKKKLDPDSKIREQARRVISKLSGIGKPNEQSQVKPHVQLLFLSREPKIDWGLEGLSPDILDDRIIASILTERDAQGFVLVITGDLGLRLKAQAKGIPWHTLPDSLLLSITKSPLELENARLKERLSRLENRLPELKFFLQSDGNNESFARFTLKTPPPLTQPDIEIEISQIRKQCAYVPPAGPSDATAFLLRGYFGISQADVDAYNKEVEAYLAQMPEYLKKKWAYKELLSRLIKLSFVIVNEGNEPAEDIDIFLHFQDGFKLCDKDGFPKGPAPPDKPSPPKSMIEKWQDMGKYPISDLIRPFPSPMAGYNLRQDTPKGPFIKKTNSYEVKYSVPKLKHGLEMVLSPVCAIFPSIDDARSFHISYSIIAGNIPDEIKGELHIVLSAENA